MIDPKSREESLAILDAMLAEILSAREVVEKASDPMVAVEALLALARVNLNWSANGASIALMKPLVGK